MPIMFTYFLPLVKVGPRFTNIVSPSTLAMDKRLVNALVRYVSLHSDVLFTVEWKSGGLLKSFHGKRASMALEVISCTSQILLYAVQKYTMISISRAKLTPPVISMNDVYGSS